jgi:hypothetical protein
MDALYIWPFLSIGIRPDTVQDLMAGYPAGYWIIQIAGYPVSGLTGYPAISVSCACILSSYTYRENYIVPPVINQSYVHYYTVQQ